jgi:hypothetical protein
METNDSELIRNIYRINDVDVIRFYLVQIVSISSRNFNFLNPTYF